MGNVVLYPRYLYRIAVRGAMFGGRGSVIGRFYERDEKPMAGNLKVHFFKQKKVERWIPVVAIGAL